jgi:hypothetical protein
MPSLTLVEVVEILPSLWSVLYGFVVRPRVSLETSSFFQLVLRPSIAPVVYLRAALFPEATTPTPVTLDFL